MAERLNKLCEFLNNQNYDLAIQAHRTSNQGLSNLDESYQLKLAKAYFFISNDYRQAIQILQKVRDSRSLELYYEARMLLVKACYLLGLNPQDSTRVLQQLKTRVSNEVRDNSNLNKYLNGCIKEVEEAMNTQVRNAQLSRSGFADQQRKQFQKLLSQEDDNSIIMEGMPKFLVASKWYSAWKDFTATQKIQRQKKHPGPITQFQLIDHPFKAYYDPTPSKEYTNRYIFNGPCYEILPKKCWQFLKQRYGGIEIKRFNISFIDKPYEIMTEVYLKRIEIAKVEKERPLTFFYVQITKKESWAGLKNKLAITWGPGDIYEFDERKNNLIVNDSQILEDVDTVGKRYIYTQQDKVSAQNGKKAEKCGNRECKQTEKLIFCKCKSIKYCGMDCLKADFKNHKKKCELEEAHLKQQSVIFKNFNLEEKDYGGMKGRVGLKNLGNTCYMNSGLQCLSNTKEMTEFFMKDDFKNHINYSNPLGTKGNLACTYAELMREMWTGQNQSVSPFKLKKIIGNIATQFSGFGQQDSQEFISYLIDSLSQDLNLVKKKETFEASDDIKADEVMSRQSQLNYAKRIQSYIRNLMVGQFKSTVICSTCSKTSVCFDPFLLISLPIPVNDQWEFFFVPTDLSRGAIKFPMEYSRTTTLQRVTKELVVRYNKRLEQDKQSKQKLSPDRLFYLILDGDNFSIIKFLQGNEKIASIKGRYILFCLQIPSLKDEEAFVAEFIYKEERFSFPRILKLPKKANPAAKQAIICQALNRGNTASNQISYVDSVIGERVTESKPFRIMEIKCKKKYKLLTYIDAFKQGISRFMEPTEEVALTLDDCLNSFAQEQSLVGENLWYCNKCKEHKEATRHLELYKSNKILVIAFKRFNRLRKIRTSIKFPIQNFNMGPYLLSNKSKQPIIYDLYGVVNHYGTMGGGHYTAYCQNFLNKKWYEFNDSRVSEISRNDIVSGDSYVLFFRRKDG